MTKPILAFAMIAVTAMVTVGCTTHTKEKEHPTIINQAPPSSPAVINQDLKGEGSGSAAAAREQGYREGVRDTLR